jgi:starch synthase
MSPPLRIAYLNYGAQSGVTPNIASGLQRLGHAIEHLDVSGALALRIPGTRLPRPTPRVLLSLAASFVQYRRQGLDRRWNTAYAFDVHSDRASQLLRRLRERPQVVLQNGALFSPGRPSPLPYVLLLDNTCALALSRPAVPEAELPACEDFGPRWVRRERDTYRGAQAIATFSNRVKLSLVRDYGIDPGRVDVVGAGANVCPERVERQDDGETLLFVGKGDFRGKGGPVLLRAFQRLRAQRPRARLLLVGPTEPLALPEGAICLGLVPCSELPGLFARATAFVLPTLHEPFGLAFLDAMACGVPCVGTRTGAVPEILDEGRLGALVPPGDERALADAVLSLLQDPLRARALGARGREEVLRRGLLWPEVGQRVAAVLDRAASEGARRAA